MLSKIKGLMNFMKENKRFTISVFFIVIALNIVIAFSYFGTSRILNKNIDTTALGISDKYRQSIRDYLVECEMYVPVMAESLKQDISDDEKQNILEEYSDRLAETYSTDYLGYYAEFKNKVFSDTEINLVKNKHWYKLSDINKDEVSFDIKTAETLAESYVVVSFRDNHSLVSVFVDAGVLQRYAENSKTWNDLYNIAILNDGKDVMYCTDDEFYTIYGASFEDNKSKEIIDSIKNKGEKDVNIRFVGPRCRGYYTRFMGNWQILVYVEQDVLYKNLYVFGFIQYGVIVLIFILFLFFYFSSFRSNIKVEQALKTRSAFIANISHEIRTPLNAIIGMSEVLLRRNLQSAARNDVVAIHNAGTGLLAIINDILDYSKMESGSFKIIEEEYDLPGLITEVINLISFRIKSKDVMMLVKINPAVPKRLIGDEVRIKQILVNILGNAAKFTHHGYITLTVDWDFIDNGETNLTLSVEDTGIGIDEKEVQMLFDEFMQADAGEKSKHQGTGLGLYISKTLARQMQGDISVESTLGKGSTFTVRVKNKVENYAPVAAVADENLMLGIYEKDISLAERLGSALEMMNLKYRLIVDNKKSEDFVGLTHIFFRQKWKNEVGRKLGSLKQTPCCVILIGLNEEVNDVNAKKLMLNLFGLQVADCLNDEIKYFDRYSGFDTGEIVAIPDARVLIVDDNVTNMAVAQGILAEYNLVIDTAMDGKQAVEMVSQNKYDIVFMDNMMPVMDGIEATRRIREMEGDYYKNLPIIALTALAGRGDRERFQRLGFDEFLSKPIDLTKMDDLLHKFLQNKIKDIYNISSEKSQNISIEQDLVIDTDAGIRQIGQSVESYVDILTIFVSDMERRYSQLISDGMEENFVINVHAIKGSSANVGAYRLNEMAAEMEKLGKDKNIKEIEVRLEQFLQLLNLTIQSARAYIDEYKGKKNKTKEFRHMVDRKLVNAMIKACDDMDMITVESLYDKMIQFVYPENTMKMLENVRLASFEYDYDKIVKYAKELKK